MERKKRFGQRSINRNVLFLTFSISSQALFTQLTMNNHQKIFNARLIFFFLFIFNIILKANENRKNEDESGEFYFQGGSARDRSWSGIIANRSELNLIGPRWIKSILFQSQIDISLIKFIYFRSNRSSIFPTSTPEYISLSLNHLSVVFCFVGSLSYCKFINKFPYIYNNFLT